MSDAGTEAILAAIAGSGERLDVLCTRLDTIEAGGARVDRVEKRLTVPAEADELILLTAERATVIARGASNEVRLVAGQMSGLARRVARLEVELVRRRGVAA